ncbi:MAG: hypothetical protein GC160_28280 [Acidobacteria bacterium]|nr:hypothetical protein [Acidobacteriota bacterium]
MTRARKAANRSQRLIVRLTDEERAAIRAAASDAGLGVSEFVRRAALDRRVVVRSQSAYGMALASQLRRIGVNLNQLMPIAHLDGEIPPELLQVAKKIERLLDRILEREALGK